MRNIIAKALILTMLILGLNSLIPINNVSANEEMRGVWATSVFSIDFPNLPSTNPDIIKSNIDSIVENARDMKLNTIFFQVRPACDALYKSSIFPWSKYLTGTQGTAPDSNFDPLEYAIQKAHENGIKLHAWINPYRVTASSSDNDTLASNNPAIIHPELVVLHSDGKMYLNPGEPATNQLVVDGALEIVKNYNVDGIHLDDYFYPSSDFEDSRTFEKYGSGYSNIEDFRRANITNLIKGLYTTIKAENPNVQFGVSPAGIWINKINNALGSDTKGKETYYASYADTRQWVTENMLDYIIPQVYWNIGYDIADFNTISNWWNDVAEGSNVKVYIGLAGYRTVNVTDENSPWYGEDGINEIKNQISHLRSLKNVSGYSIYSFNSTMKNTNLYETMKVINSDAVPTPEPAPSQTSVPAQTSEHIFNDVEKYDWAKEAITELVNRGIIKGVSDIEFAPSNNITRADYTLLITRMVGKSATFSDNFSDVATDKYYYNEIGIAKSLGFASGMGNNMFYPANNISRQDMAVMAYRILKNEGIISDKNISSSAIENFSDKNEIADYAKEAISVMVNHGLLKGYGDSTFMPSGNATRAETAVFIYRILSLLKS